eukprot:TRINITY_DN2590_c0_g1_i1.p1 TRINITY_DN2590_c0_g1~~TRINITY_DN2590_c0_g1_i1.p1  ORF type:complete len:232 (+),score=29.22 TRINITY_DN2590_c0_g1_i1:55-750(+)
MTLFTCIKLVLLSSLDDRMMMDTEGVVVKQDLFSLFSNCLTVIKDQIIPKFNVELLFLERIIYKNNNQHRNAIYFKHVKKVHRRLALFRLKEIIQELNYFISGSNTQYSVIFFMNKVYALHMLALNAMELAKTTYLHFCDLIRQTYFMPLAVVMVSLLSRFYTLIEDLVPALVDLYFLLKNIADNNRFDINALDIFHSHIGTLPQSLGLTKTKMKLKEPKVDKMNVEYGSY